MQPPSENERNNNGAYHGSDNDDVSALVIAHNDPTSRFTVLGGAERT
jgi:hypothetical protein